MLARTVQRFGLLRVLLAFGTLGLIGVSPFAHRTDSLEEGGLFFAAIAPSLVAILIFVLPLDMAMTRIFLSDADPANKARLWRVIKGEAILLLMLVLAWTPFFSSLLVREP